MQINDDGTASYFAVLKKSSAAQKQRIEKNAEKKKEAKKAEAKKAQKEAQKERLEKSKDKTGNVSDDDDDTVTITASSIDELLDKIQAQNQLFMSDNVQTEDEKKVGQKFDFICIKETVMLIAMHSVRIPHLMELKHLLIRE